MSRHHPRPDRAGNFREESRKDLHTLKNRLGERAAELGEALFGKPTSTTRRELRWGTRGSTSIRLDGRNGPSFYSFEAGVGGDMLEAIRFAHSCDFKHAIKLAREFLGGEQLQPKARSIAIDVDREEARRRTAACALWTAARPIDGRPTRTYLASRALGDGLWTTELVRHAPREEVVRQLGWGWWRGSAAVFPIRNAGGEVTAVQLIAIDDTGRPVTDREGKKIKRTRGLLRGGAIRLPGDAEKPLLLAEGPETGASVWMATGLETWSLVGSTGRADLASIPISRTVVICADDDPARAPSSKGVRDALKLWRREGRIVLVAKPWDLTKRDKSDFNDTLKQRGASAVRERIEAAFVPNSRVHGRLLGEASEECGRLIAQTIASLVEWKPAVFAGTELAEDAPFKVIRVETGAGKTELALREVLALAQRGIGVVFMGPTHEQLEEARQRFTKMADDAGVRVPTEIWRGRSQPNPSRRGENMCIEHKLAEEISIAGGNADDLCKICQYSETCEQGGYRRQKETIATVWFAPSSLMWSRCPEAMKHAKLLVIDESFALGGIRDERRSAKISLRDLELLPTYNARERRLVVTGPDGKRRRRRIPLSDVNRVEEANDIATEVMPIRRCLLKALGEHDDGGLSLDRLHATGMTAELAEKAHDLISKLYVKISITDGMTHDGIRDQLQSARGNGAVAREAMLWRLLAEQIREAIPASGRLRLYDRKAQDDDTCTRTLELTEPAKIAARWREMPTLHMDATASIDLVRQRAPHAELVADLGIDAPHVRAIQYCGPAFGKRSLAEGKMLGAAWHWSIAQARLRGGRCLVITHKAAVERIRDRYEVPSFISLASFGAVAGLDGFGDVRTLIVLGRWGTKPSDVARTAGILSGHEVKSLGTEWYPGKMVTLRGFDGSARTVEADEHPDPLAEAVRAGTVQAELLQAIGRGRGIRRKDDQPLDVLICGNTPTGLPLASVREWQPLTADEVIFAKQGIWAQSHSTMSGLSGVPTATIKKARDRAATTGTGTSRYSFTSACPCRQAGALAEELGGLFAGWSVDGGSWPADLGVTRIKRAGRQYKAELVVFDRRSIGLLHGWLEDRLGALADFQEIDATSAALGLGGSQDDVVGAAGTAAPEVASRAPEADSRSIVVAASTNPASGPDRARMADRLRPIIAGLSVPVLVADRDSVKGAKYLSPG